ncbi:MAG: hypothetical protein IT289_02550 [Oligoflexia bacterium]|nr:hypothetical protein [Oligoflexia bacterium]
MNRLLRIWIWPRGPILALVSGLLSALISLSAWANTPFISQDDCAPQLLKLSNGSPIKPDLNNFGSARGYAWAVRNIVKTRAGDFLIDAERTSTNEQYRKDSKPYPVSPEAREPYFFETLGRAAQIFGFKKVSIKRWLLPSVELINATIDLYNATLSPKLKSYSFGFKYYWSHRSELDPRTYAKRYAELGELPVASFSDSTPRESGQESPYTAHLFFHDLYHIGDFAPAPLIRISRTQAAILVAFEEFLRKEKPALAQELDRDQAFWMDYYDFWSKGFDSGQGNLNLSVYLKYSNLFSNETPGIAEALHRMIQDSRTPQEFLSLAVGDAFSGFHIPHSIIRELRLAEKDFLAKHGSKFDLKDDFEWYKSQTDASLDQAVSHKRRTMIDTLTQLIKDLE